MKVKFPRDFVWGTAISAFQTEMGSSEESIFRGTDWFQWTHSDQIRKEGLVSADRPEHGDGFWDLYKEDMLNAASLGTNSIRISIEWARIFPLTTEQVECIVTRNQAGGIVGVVMMEKGMSEIEKLANQVAVKHYLEMMDHAKRVGLSVFLTLYHWPLPLWLHDPVEVHNSNAESGKKGWLDEQTIIEFGKFAQFAAKTFGKAVDIWETINEPEVIAINGYYSAPSGRFPPALDNPALVFEVERNLAYAHTVAYKNIKIACPSSPVGIGCAPPCFSPASDNVYDSNAAEYARYLNNEWFLNAALSGLLDQDLDEVADQRIDGMSGSDFIGIDYYQRVRVSSKSEQNHGKNLNFDILPCVDCTDFQWDIFPEGISQVVRWIFHKYRIPIYILENGIADSSDFKRSRFIQEHLFWLGKTIQDEEIPVKGYYHWSLVDNFEWAKGFSMRFGLFEVDYSTRERKKRQSATIFEGICRSGEVEVS